MNNLFKLLSTLPDGERQAKRLSNIHRFSGVSFDLAKHDGNTLVISATQVRKITDKSFNRKELSDFARPAFSILEEQGFTVHINAYAFTPTGGMEDVTASWVRERMQQRGLSQRQMGAAMGVDEFRISKLLNNKTAFTAWHKAAFWHYFTNDSQN